MKIEIENVMLVPASNYLYGLNTVRKQSRMRGRLIKMLNERSEVYQEDRRELQEEHSNKDEDGKAIINDGQYDIKDMVAFSNDLKELNEEKYVIEGGDNREMIRTIKEILGKFEDEEYGGQESEAYDYLCEQFKIDEETESEEE